VVSAGQAWRKHNSVTEPFRHALQGCGSGKSSSGPLTGIYDQNTLATEPAADRDQLGFNLSLIPESHADNMHAAIMMPVIVRKDRTALLHCAGIASEAKFIHPPRNHQSRVCLLTADRWPQSR